MRWAVARGVVARRVVEEDRELVAAEARRGVSVAHAEPDAVGDLDQEQIAGLVAERVVDHLEAVEIGEHHDDRRRDPPSPSERMIEPIARAARGWRGR